MNRAELVHALEMVAPALANTNLVQVFTHFMFTKGHVSTYDDKTAIIAKCAHPVATPFSVFGKTFLELLKNTQAENVDFSLEKEHLSVKAGRSSFKLPYGTGDEFVFERPTDKWDVTLTLNEDVLKGIEVCLTTAARDEQYRALMGVCLNFEKSAVLYSCDSDAITRYVLTGKVKGSGRHMLPNQLCDAMLKIAKETETTQGEIKINDTWACVAFNNGFTVYGRQIEKQDEPFDYAQQLADTLPAKAAYVEAPAGLADAVARARVVAEAETAPTRLSVAAGRLKLVTEANMGTVRDELALKGHPDVEALVHAKLVAKALTICDHVGLYENCTAYKREDKIVQVIANLGE